ncbi:MAG: SIMPL domain-containing protein [Flavobacteriales bacterium]|nr:SIMPL domain-containing protein [Flavobacteriales bacterium]
MKLDLKSVLVGVGVVAIFAFNAVPDLTSNPNDEDFKRTIDVTGSSEMDIIPDDVEIKFTYTEWLDKSGKKNTSSKMAIIEPIVIKSIVESGIAKKDISMANVYASGSYHYYRRHHRDDHVVSKTLTVCISSVETINKILKRFEMNGLDERAISSIRVGEKDHKKLTEYRKEVKKDAIKAAKEKAKYLLEAIGQEPGDALTVKEVNADNWNYGWRANSNRNSNYSNENSRSVSGSSDGLAFSAINLRYEIEVKFEIK